MPHQSEAPVRGRTGFSKIGSLLASVPSISRPSFRAACLRKIVWELFFRTGTLATQANYGQTNTQSLKITEEKLLPLQYHSQMVRLSSLLG